MPRILSKNKYEIAVGNINRLNALSEPPEAKVELEERRRDLYLDLQNKNIVLGGMYRIRYRFYENDPWPLALFLSMPREDIGCAPAINLHYLNKLHAQTLIKALKFRNAPIIKRGRAPRVFYEMIKDIQIPYKAYRLYKYEGIKPMEYIPVVDWAETVKEEKSRWQGRFY